MHGKLVGSSIDNRTRKPDWVIHEWRQIITLARHHLLLENWQDAIPAYEKALSLSEEFLISAACRDCAIKSHIRTSLEYIYALKKTNNVTAMNQLFNNVKTNIEYFFSEQYKNLLVPLSDIIQVDEATADLWINQLFYFDAESKRHVH
jgi:hypothetical protein